MIVNFGELRNKEMICVKDGLKIGFVDDVEIDTESYELVSLISYGRSRFFGLFGRQDDIKIECRQIQVIGEDIILVNDYLRQGGYQSSKRKKDSVWTHLFE